MLKFYVFILVFINIFISIHSYSMSNEKIDHLVQKFMDENEVEGMSVAVLNQNNTIILNYGFANKSKKISTKTDTIYTIASFTKTFTATLAAVASVENKLNLDASFVRYFPEVKDNADLNQITLREFLSHVSSLPFDFNPRPHAYEDLIARLKEFKPQSMPGSEYYYSNAGIGLVGYILEKLYSEKYQNILEEKILNPLNMMSTYLVVPEGNEKYIAVGHDKNNKIIPYNKNLEVLFAAASLKSTIVDMAKYLNAHINAASIKDLDLAKAIPIVHENKYCFADKLACEQLAWQAHVMSELKRSTGDTYFIDYDRDGNPMFDKKKIIKNNDFSKNKIFIDKTGSGYGMSSYMVYIPEKKIGVVLLLNKWIGDERIRLGRDLLSSLND